MNLKNKNILIVGSKGLIGKAIVNKLKKQKVKIFTIEKNKKNNSKYNFYIKSELARDQINEFKIIISKIKKIDVFVNCSYPKNNYWNDQTFQKSKYENFSENLELHLNTFCFFSKMVAQKMKKNKTKGSIINLSSIYGVVAQDLSIYNNTKIEENISYAPIKSGIIGFTKLLASYYAKFGIRANTVSPGGVISRNMSKIFLKNYKKRIPIKRLCEPSEVADPIIFLGSDASSYITGINLLVDGGWTSI
jgi:NAD(P)-dependent dehydrogenase (short-subunit alcohol dehydrogenase family)|tara:strand:+ start:886 stop:1629 length:744 start_codon:yes stop_codon:yes gene_type:complete